MSAKFLPNMLLSDNLCYRHNFSRLCRSGLSPMYSKEEGTHPLLTLITLSDLMYIYEYSHPFESFPQKQIRRHSYSCHISYLIMPQHRDYSQILDVYPHDYSFTCVGITQKGLRCRQSFILEADKNSAVDILHQMNSHRAWESSFPYLKDLAYLTLCPRWHRKPGYSQVESVSARWRAKITECAVLEITDGLTDSYQTRHNRLHVCYQLSHFKRVIQTNTGSRILNHKPGSLFRCLPPL